MNKIILLVGVFMASTALFGQQNQELLTPLKPANEKPATFTSQAHMDEKKEAKIEAIKAQIIENQNNPERVKVLRQDLWRFENAIVVERN